VNFTFQPQIIKRDSAVPLRLIVGGWAVGVLSILAFGTVANVVIALMGITLLAGGLFAVSLNGHRTWRMVLGATAGAVALWLGYRFAFADRLFPVRTRPRDLLDTELVAAVVLGLGVTSIGAGGLLEAVRAQAAPGRSPLVVRGYLVVVGMFIAGILCTEAGVSNTISLLAVFAAGVGLGALAWLRRERPESLFSPQP